MTEAPTQTILLNRLAESLAGEKASATFACGGKIVESILKTSEGDTIAPANPILFYEDKNGQSHKITFPAGPQEMETLSAHCDPASFGVGSEERLDTEYRSAWKLDNTKFATSFHPFDSDVMEVVKRLLFSGAINLGALEPLVVAELYKLNIYKGPHDKFKPHVDTPRAENQFGSLVVCLPSAHKGGELAVRHDGREMKFDWSNDSTSVQWAAFYSDCEHEVLPVTEGYRVTLTYNLYYSNRGHQIPESINWRESTLPLYQSFAQVLQSKEFMPKGGVLGVYCHHNYAHAAKSPDERIPSMLKGADAAIWAVCAAFGLDTETHPVFLTTADGEAWRPGWNGAEYPPVEKSPPDDYTTRNLKKMRHDPLKIFGVKPTSKDHIHKKSKIEWIGSGFSEVCEVDYLGDQEDWMAERLAEVNWATCYGGIHWLNKASHKEGNVAYVTYGNEPGVGMLYSAAAMFILVPKWDELRGVNPSLRIEQL